LGYADAISAPSYCGHRVPAAIIRHAIWPDLRFILGYRDLEVLLARFGNGRNGELQPTIDRTVFGSSWSESGNFKLRHYPRTT
jgi:hypothetical protein